MIWKRNGDTNEYSNAEQFFETPIIRKRTMETKVKGGVSRIDRAYYPNVNHYFQTII